MVVLILFVPEVPAPEVPAQKRRYRKLGGLGAHCCRRTCCGSTCLPVSADLSGGAERKCRKKRRWRRRQRLRQFSDLWVRLEKRFGDEGASCPGKCLRCARCECLIHRLKTGDRPLRGLTAAL
ncbi:hypothetical protein CB1_000688083 [Camelus ferus]|nr:hypothetical protein CB1_000688083 [Camelus ferus]